MLTFNKKFGRLKKSRPTEQTFYNGAKVRYFFRSCKFPLKNLRKMSFTSLDLFGACWMRSSTSKSKFTVKILPVRPRPFGVLFHLLFFSSCSIIFPFLLSVFACGCASHSRCVYPCSSSGKRATSRYFLNLQLFGCQVQHSSGCVQGIARQLPLPCLVLW